MSNTLINDQGVRVPAVGAPGSLERARCEWPDLLARLTALREAGTITRYRATRLMSARGVQLHQDRMVILQAAGFSEAEATELCGWKVLGSEAFPKLREMNAKAEPAKES